MDSNSNYWETFRKIPIAQRSNFLQNILTLTQIHDKIQIPQYQYPEDQYVEANGMKHHVYIWPKNKYSGVLFLMHGMDGHGGASGTLAKFVNDQTDLIVVSLDFRNSGKSIFDEHGYIESVDVLIRDAEAVIDSVIKRYSPKKLFLGGVSMGGGVAFRMALNRPFLYNGIILFAPALRGNYQNAPFMKKLGKLLGSLFPRWKFLDNSSGSGNRHSCFNNTGDPLNYNGKIIPGSIKAILQFMQENQKLLDKLQIPYLMLVGASDKIIDPFVAVDLDVRCKSKDKTTYVVKDMWHYIPLEPQYMSQIIPLVVKWLNDRSI